MARRLTTVRLLAVLVFALPVAAAAQAPTITQISPNIGSDAGGTDVQIDGTNLATVTSVTFGGTPAVINFQLSTVMLVTTPAHAAGPVNVVATNPDGPSVEAITFTYVTPNGPAPTVTVVSSPSPAKGSTVGGTAITITGTNFRKTGDGGATGDATVKIGNVNATSVVVVNATTITAVTPARQGGSSGAVNVVVTNSDGTSGSLVSGFTYVVFCDVDVTVNCISDFTVDPLGPGSGGAEGNPPPGVDALLLGTDTGFQVSIVNNNNPDRFELTPDVTAADVIKIVLEVGAGLEPVIALSTGDIQDQGFQWDAGASQATVRFKPRASSWNGDPAPAGGCQLPPGTCAERATVDYTALALLALDGVPDLEAVDPDLRDDLQGVFLSSNAQAFSTPTYDPEDGAFTFEVGAPHFKFDDTNPADDGDDDGDGIFLEPAELADEDGDGISFEPAEDAAEDGDVNEPGFFNFFISDVFAANQWGITDTSVLVNDPTQLTVTIGGDPITPTITDVAAGVNNPAGIKIAFENFHYSVEDIAIIIAPTVTSISPTVGPIAGGTAVTITGLNFRAGATVSIGGVAATSVVVVSSTTITAVTGAHAAGTASVTVTNSDATTDALAVGFTFVTPAVSVDLNNDGGGDAFLYNVTTGAWRFQVTNSTATGFTGDASTWDAGWQVFPANLNGDTYTDLFLYDPARGLWVQARNNAGDGTFTYTVGDWDRNWQVYPADLNGDAITDVFVYDVASGTWVKCFVDGSGGFTTYTAGRWDPGWSFTIGDLNGDGRDDFFLYNRASGAWVETLSQAGFGEFDYPASGQWDLGWEIYPADLNGDGRTDLFLYNASGVQNAAGVNVTALSRAGGDFDYPFVGQWDAGWTIHSGDLNNDGRTDLFLYNATTGGWVEAFSNGAGDFTYAVGNWNPGWTVRVTDLNNDGRADVLVSNANGTWVQAVNVNDGMFSETSGNWGTGWTPFTR